MSIEELLRPRYKVIADYPGNIIPVGSIFWDDVESIEIITPTGSRSVQGSYPYRNKDKFPHLFKKLEWWEDRRREEMPEFVKNINEVVKVHKYIAGGKIMEFANGTLNGLTDLWLPATLAEYEQYINQKEKQ